MKIINFGNQFEVYPDDLSTFDALPVQTYEVKFNPLAGFSLAKAEDFKNIEGKIYGTHLSKVNKILKSYESIDRSLGVIYSGNKGMGKSLSTQLLSIEAMKKGLPVIIVNKAYVGIADFLDKIKQEVLIIFDEFEKMFEMKTLNHGEPSRGAETQDALLGLFDGISQQKRIYVLTVNDLHKLSDYLLNRTGRFHYHIRFDYPTQEAAQEYLMDKVAPEYHGEIKNVLNFSTRVNLNYDSLRSIAFELNQGYTFRSSIADLNIITTNSQSYDIEVTFPNGSVESNKGVHLNLFSDEASLSLHASNNDYFRIEFDPTDLTTTPLGMLIEGDKVNVIGYGDNEYIKPGINATSVKVSIHKSNAINYKLAY